MILFLRADVKYDVRHGQQVLEFFPVTQVVAVEVGRVNDDLVLQGRAVVGNEPALAQSRIESVQLHVFVIIDDRVASGRARDRGLGDIAAG